MSDSRRKTEPDQQCPGTELNRRHADFQSAGTGRSRSDSGALPGANPECGAGVAVSDPRLPQRFWDKVAVDDSGCWRWTGSTDSSGYAKLKVGGRVERAHRTSYLALVGPIPPRLQLDHLCRVRCCVNPAHLEPVTARTNVLRSLAVTAANAAATHCRRGHPFDESNTYYRPTRNGHRGRTCRACQRRRTP